MSSKILNREVVRKAVTSRFWESDRNELFADSFHIEMPNAAPGMPQVMDEFEVGAYFKWLSETVDSWDVELHTLLGTPDPDVFWAVSSVKAQVRWGGTQGLFETRRFARYELKNGKIVFLAELSNPLKWLEAAGREIPIFRMDLYHQNIEAALDEGVGDPHGGDESLDMSPDAIDRRIANGVSAFMSGDYWNAVTHLASYMPGYETNVWFLPPEMQEYYPPELLDRVGIWSVLSCPVIEFDRRGRVWETDDPHIYFGEYYCYGITDWLGNNTPNSRYRNRYFYCLHFNDAGQISCVEEVLNPINKYNSINISLPSFPYYF